MCILFKGKKVHLTLEFYGLNVDCLTSCCTIGVHQKHPDSFQSSKKRQADISKTRSLKDCRTYRHWWLIFIRPDWLCDDCVIWPRHPSRLTYIWPEGRPLGGHLLGWTYDMRTFQIQIQDSDQWLFCGGIRDGSRETQPFSLVGKSGPPTARILRTGLLIHSHLWIMLLITLRSKDSINEFEFL